MNLKQVKSNLDCHSLIVKGITQSGEINKNLISGVVTPPFAESEWLMTGEDTDKAIYKDNMDSIIFSEWKRKNK